MVPTFGRADTKLPKFIETATKYSSCKESICFTFCTNEKDAESDKVIELMLSGYDYQILKEGLEKPHLAKFWNMLYRDSRFNDESTVVTMLGDDMEFRTEDWDVEVLKWVNSFNGIGIFFSDDCKGTRDNLCVNIFTTRKYIDAQSPYPFMCELYPCDDMDVVHNYVSIGLGRRFYMHNVKIFHNHATLPGQMDETWKRLRTVFDETKENRTQRLRGGCVWGNEEYEGKVVERLRENIKEELRPELGVMMTTCNREELLRDTVVSYKKAISEPGEIHVFDDGSINPVNIENIVNMMRGCVFHKSDVGNGCTVNNLSAIRWMFENTEHDAIIVLDSDCVFSRYWWQRANDLYKRLKERKDFGCASLFNVRAHEGCEVEGVPNVLRKIVVGGLSMIIPREFWEKYIAPLAEKKNIAWDNEACMAASLDGNLVCCSTPSFVQHTGIYEGTHVCGSTSYAADYVDTCNIYQRYSSGPEKNNKALVAMMGRYGDVILGSMVVNMLVAEGIGVTVLTTPFYRDLVSMLSPMVTIKVTGANPQSPWETTSTKEMHDKYCGYQYYINLQPGSPEHHNNLIGSGTHMAWFVKGIAEAAIGRRLPDDFAAYKADIKTPGIVVANRKFEKPLAILCPSVISCEPALTMEAAHSMRDKLSGEYDAKILTEKRPQVGLAEIREKYTFGYTFMQCFTLLRECSLYIGNDSGLAWVSLFSDCEKKIYHLEKRVKETNVMYSKIDPKAEDIIL
jgi:hypothetical protein